MMEPDVPDDSAALRFSALLDGEMPREAVAEACRDWRGDPQRRAQWHTYSLIGDVLRSGDLARPVGRDLAFLEGVRERLAHEPVVLAPSASAWAADRLAQDSSDLAIVPSNIRQVQPARHRWLTPVGIAAGVALVGALAWTGMPAPESPAPMLAIAVTPAPQVDGSALSNPQTSPGEPLEPYLNAHRMVPGKAAFGPAPGFMRSVAHDPVAR